MKTNVLRVGSWAASLVAAIAVLLSATSTPPAWAEGSHPAVKSFCEYGYATSLQFGPAGAVWLQSWGKPATDWYVCEAEPDVTFLNPNVIGLLRTTTSGPPVVGPGLILHLPFKGQVTLIATTENQRGRIAGTIVGDIEGTFVVDLDATHAVVTDEVITVQFGAPVNNGPDGLIKVMQTRGKFQNMQAVGLWEWHVSGTMTIKRLPNLPPQQNILAALANASLLLGAEEEIVLTGSYFRTTPEEPGEK